MKKYTLIICVALIALSSWGVFVYTKQTMPLPAPVHAPRPPEKMPMPAPKPHPYIPVEIILPAIQASVMPSIAQVTARSPKVFAYAHGTIVADGKIFLGMAAAAGNRFQANQLTIFNAADISRPTFVSVPMQGEIDTIIYDAVNDRIYFELSNNGGLHIFSLDPHTYAVSVIVSTTTVDVGRRPAIVTDGMYVYGITNTTPSSVFKVKIRGGELTVNKNGHIPNGHSAAIGIYASSTELYFGGGMMNGFEKVDAATLESTASTTIGPCAMSDDMPHVQTGPREGYVYIGCETVPYGVRVSTGDMSFDRFQLPGASLGLFVYGHDLYNAAQDGYIDAFPNADLTDLRRYRVTDDVAPFDTKGQSLEPNEILYSPETSKLYFTAWLGIEGLYQVSTSTPSV